jgi:hypothetical protein
MADKITSLSTVTSRPLAQRFKLYAYQPVCVWSGELPFAHAQGAESLSVETLTGNGSDVTAGMTCRVTTAGGASKMKPSKVRAKDWTPLVLITGTLDVAENAIDWDAGDKVYVYRFWELGPRVPVIDQDTGAISKDGDTTWSSDNAAQPPVANAGPAVVATLSGGQADVVFSDEGSFVVPSGGAVTSYEWDALGGSPAVQAGAENTSTVTYRYTSAGYYYVSLTVTDANGETDVKYVPVIIDDGTLDLGYVTLGRRDGDKSGWRLSFNLETLTDDVINTIDDYLYDGALIILVSQDDDQQADEAFVDNRAETRYVGWCASDQLRRDALNRTVSFDVVSSNELISNIPAYPIGIRDEAAPSDWYGLTDLSIDSVVVHILRWHSTVLQVCDYIPIGDWTDRARPGENCKADSLLDQIDDVLRACFANLRCDRQGILRATRDYWHLSDTEKAARDTLFTLAKSHIISVSFTDPHQASVREVRLGGTEGTNAYLSGAPPSPLDGGRPGEVMNLAPKTQSELNRWAGQDLAIKNWQKPIRVEMAGEFDVADPALCEILDGDLSDFDARLPDGPYTIESISFRDEPGVTMSTWTLLADPGEYGGETKDIPDAPDRPDPPDLEDPEIDPRPAIGTGEVVGVGGIGGFFWTDDALTGSPPTWAAFNTGLTSVAYISALDQPSLNPRWACCLAHTSVTAPDDGIVYVTTNWRGTTSWSSKLTPAAATTLVETAIGDTITADSLAIVDVVAISVDYSTTYLLAVIQYEYGAAPDEQTRVLRSTDWGDNWTCGGEIAGHKVGATEYTGWVYYNKDTEGSGAAITDAGDGELVYDGSRLLLCAKSPTASEFSGVQISTDWGATWEGFDDYPEGDGGVGNSAEGVTAADVDSTGKLWLARWKDATSGNHVIASCSNIGAGTPVISTVKTLTDEDSYADVRDMLAINANDAWYALQVVTPNDRTGDTYVQKNGSTVDTLPNPYRTLHCFLVDGDVVYALRSFFNDEDANVSYPSVFYATTDGATFSDKSGNLRALGCDGGCGIISDWTND